jgi:hypothetical protein
MDAKRERSYMDAMRNANAKTHAAKQKFRQRLKKGRPWRALAEEWREEMWRVFGKDVRLAPWREKEEALARKLVAEVGYEVAEKMAHQFIRSWDEAGLPTLPYLWVRRESVLAMVKGQAKTRRKVIDIDEFDAEKARKHPKIGWA